LSVCLFEAIFLPFTCLLQEELEEKTRELEKLKQLLQKKSEDQHLQLEWDALENHKKKMDEATTKKTTKKTKQDISNNDSDSAISVHIETDGETTVSLGATDEFEAAIALTDLDHEIHDDDDDEPQEILAHSTKTKEVKLTVLLKKNKKTTVPLWAAWADYPELVRTYRTKKKLCRNKALMIPKEQDCEEIVFIQGHQGDPIVRPAEAKYDIVWQNGYVDKGIEHSAVVQDAPKLLNQYIKNLE
jgi:hypothetical protein